MTSVQAVPSSYMATSNRTLQARSIASALYIYRLACLICLLEFLRNPGVSTRTASSMQRVGTSDFPGSEMMGGKTNPPHLAVRQADAACDCGVYEVACPYGVRPKRPTFKSLTNLTSSHQLIRSGNHSVAMILQYRSLPNVPGCFAM